jgi:hypothetical protein
MCLLWDAVPTVTENDLRQRWHFERSALSVRVLSRLREPAAAPQ